MNLRDIYIKYKMILWPIIAGVSSLVVLSLVIVPQLLAFVSTRDAITNIDNRFHSLEVKAEELSQINNQKAKSDLQAVFSVLPTDMDVPQAMTILQNLVLRNGLELKSTAFVGNKNSNQKSFQLNISVAGGMGSIRNFLVSLQDAPRIFQVESINAKFQKNNAQIMADIPITVFYQPQTNQSNQVDQPVPKLNQEEEDMITRFTRIAGVIQNLETPQPASGSTLPPASSTPIGKLDPFE